MAQDLSQSHPHYNISQTKPVFDRLTRQILMVGWMIYILASPFYVFQSGLPQPADFIIFMTSGLAIIIFIFKEQLLFNRVFATMFMMVGLFVMINAVNFYYFKDTLFLYTSVYYVFNAFIFCTTVVLFKSNPAKFIDYTRFLIFASLIIELIWLFSVNSPGGFRNAGSFNNPNQLGYWALLSACGLLILNYGQRMAWHDVMGFFIALFLGLESLSRAVSASFILLIILFLINRYVGFIPKIIMGFLLIAYALFQFVMYDNFTILPADITVIDKVIERIDSGSNIEKRGYDRIIDNPQYLFFGAGEGGYNRFSSIGLELHSGLGTILFSYGLLGFILFSLFVLTVFQRAPWMLWLTLMAVMAYGLTHQHIRFTWFWIFLGLAYGMSRYVLPYRHSQIK